MLPLNRSLAKLSHLSGCFSSDCCRSRAANKADFSTSRESRSLASGAAWTSKGAQNHGPISQNREHRQYRVHGIGHFGGPGGPSFLRWAWKRMRSWTSTRDSGCLDCLVLRPLPRGCPALPSNTTCLGLCLPTVQWSIVVLNP